MTAKYTLFLDESEDRKNNIFCIAGFIIKNDDLMNLDNKISTIKEILWDKSYIENNNPILHSTELNSVYKNKNNPKKYNYAKNSAHRKLIAEDPDTISSKYKQVYQELSILIKGMKITILSCIIDKNKFKDYYCIPPNEKLLDDWYEIAMQKILESFTHFLFTNKGIGSVIYEARDTVSMNQYSSLDNKMLNNYCKFKVNGKGSEYLSSRTIINHIRFFNIIAKKENNLGLQLADFIAFNYIKWFTSDENKRTEFMKKIHQATYNGSHKIPEKDLRENFGLRILPYDYSKIQTLKSELKKIKKSKKNLQNNYNKLDKKLTRIKIEKNVLNEKYIELLKKQEN